MNSIAVFALFLAAVSAAPAGDQVIAIRSQTNVVNPDGSYSWSYDTENGIAAQESGGLKNPDTIAAQGSFSYTAPDGTPINIVYTADENGFVAQGAHLPTSPPIPAAILRSLEWNAAHPEQPEQGKRPVG